MKRFFLFISFFTFFFNNVFSQIIEINDTSETESGFSLQELVENVLIPGDCAELDAFSEQSFGNPVDATTKSYGYFKTPIGSTFPFEEGIVLSTGPAFPAGNVLNSVLLNVNIGLGGDADLENALGQTNTNDATYVKFNFVPISNSISFRFIMASEEYDGASECIFADSIAFLIRELGTTTYTNLAVLPDGTPVSVFSINNSTTCASNTQYFEGYNINDPNGNNVNDTNYGGRTKVLTASAVVIPNKTYEIKLVIADQFDENFDSAIFLEAGSFVVKADLGEPRLKTENNAVCGNTVLLDANIVAPNYTWFKDNVEITGEISQTYSADLGDGLYKVEVPLTGGCSAGDEIELEFVEPPTASDPGIMYGCDSNGDGIVGFNLSDNVIDILNGQNPMTFEVLYFLDATYLNQIPVADLSDFNSSGQTIYVRVRNIDSTDCIADISFDTEVYDAALPLDAVNIVSVDVCDDTSVGTLIDGYVRTDITVRETEILNGQLAAEFELTYFTDPGYTLASEISDPVNFENTTAGGQMIYVRMTNNLETSCYADTSFEIRVFEMPVLNSPPFILERCDDDFDGFYSFNLTEINSEIVSSITTEVFTYYESSAEAEAGIVGTEITNPTTYVNEVVNTDNTLWVRIESADGCYRTTQVTLIVKPSAIPTSFLRTFSECDDGADNRDGIATFDFSSVTAEVQAMFPTAVDVFYYKNQVDATAELNEITDTSAYQNIDSPNTQDIWVRAVSQLGNDCLGSGDHIKLIVEKLPIANKPNNLTECDDDGDSEFSFDTTIVEAEILNGQKLADVTITYFNEDGTMIGTSLPNPFLTASQTIDIVIINNISNDPEGACTDNTTLEFVVGNSVEAATVLMTSSCDDDGDGISVFDTLTLESDILNGQLGMNVYYFNALGDPLIDSNGVVIISPFPSSFSTNTQTITVAIENPVNTACIATTTVDFTVLSNPVYDLEEETLICENQLPHTISVENPNQSNYIYQWFDPLGVELGIDQTLIITNSDNLTSEGIEYKVTVTNPSTNCSKTKSILVKASLLPMIAEDDIITVEFNSPGNSIEINTTNLGTGDYEFSLEHDYDYQPFQDEPIFKGLLGGIYTLLVNDKNGCGETKLTIVILDYPKFLTPNNDGQNDTWKLVGIEFTSFTISPIQIFDRFGKIVAVIDPLSQGWDGYYNGTQLPASDYWFRVQLTDSEGIILDKKGHFSLVRR